MKIWTCGSWEPIEIGQRVFIGRCGSGDGYGFAEWSYPQDEEEG